MTVLRPIIMAFAMFTKIPMPHIEWEERSMRYLFCAFPVVGLCLGLLSWGWQALGRWLALGSLATAIGYTVLPLLFTGGIHMDGFCDVTDALASYGDREKKLAILKDPHIGAFALIGACVYLLCVLGLFSELQHHALLPVMLGAVYGLSRCMAGLFVVALPAAKADGLSYTFSSSAAKRPVMAVLIGAALLLLAAALWFGALWAAALPLGMLLWTPAFLRLCKKQFGGMTGDLAGYYIQIGELVMLLCLVLLQKGGALR